MSGAAAAVGRNEFGRIGIMVRTATELFIYWQMTGCGVLRLTDLSGRAPAELLDGQGWRELSASGSQGVYLRDLLPGHLYAVDLLDEDGRPVIGAGPVQTPWLPGAAPSPFPNPYHRS